ncbi:MAG: GHMP kinase [Acidobacteria bacterium]|nr:GHMP kinase [Acidobacteriota bacterium]
MRFHAYAPTRIDLAGGTLDIWPLYLFHAGALTLNVAITCYAHAVLEPRGDGRIVLVSRDAGEREQFRSLAALEAKQRYRLPLLAELVKWFLRGDSSPSGGSRWAELRKADSSPPRQARARNDKKGLTLTTWSEVPAGAGLGGSSALAVAVCAALTRWLRAPLKPHEWIALSRDVEARVLGVPTGEQDHYPAVYGGVSAIHLDAGATWREPLRVSPRALESRLVLAYTGEPRRSGINNWQVVKHYLDGDARLHRNFAEIAAIAGAMHRALAREDWRRVAALLAREWEARRRNAPRIATPFIDRLIRTGKRHGAQAAKVCGAGGGGCVVFFCAPERRGELASTLAAAGATLLPFRLARRGVTVRREK